MFKHAILTILFSSQSVEMNFENKNVKYIQKKSLPEDADERKELIDKMMVNISDKSGIYDMSKIDAYVLMPYDMPKIYTMLEMPPFHSLKGRKFVEALSLHTENTTNHRLSNPLYYFLTQQNKKIKSTHYSVCVMDEIELNSLIKLVFETNVNIRLVGFEPDAIRRYTNQESMTNPLEETVYIHYFHNGAETIIGFYIYMEDLLAGVRYLHADSYEISDIINELNVMIYSCEQANANFRVKNYCIIANDEIFDEFIPYLPNTPVIQIKEDYISTESLFKYHEPNFIKRLFKGGYRK